MKTALSILSLASICLILSSCTSLSKSKCQEMDWYDKGYEDALDGVPASKLTEYRTKCAEHKVKINSKNYSGGWRNGAKTVCTAKKGYEDGFNKKTPLNHCPFKLKNKYLRGYRAGEKEFKRQEKARELERKANDLKKIEEDLNEEL